MTKIKLSNGIEMPAIGIGTHQALGDAAADSLALAFDEGFRSDSVQNYLAGGDKGNMEGFS